MTLTVASQDSSGVDVSAGDLTILAENYAKSVANSSAVSAGLVAAGAHINRTTQLGGAQVLIGTGSDFTSLNDARIEALSGKAGRTSTVAGAGGAFAVNGGESVVTRPPQLKLPLQMLVARPSAASCGVW